MRVRSSKMRFFCRSQYLPYEVPHWLYISKFTRLRAVSRRQHGSCISLSASPQRFRFTSSLHMTLALCKLPPPPLTNLRLAQSSGPSRLRIWGAPQRASGMEPRPKMNLEHFKHHRTQIRRISRAVKHLNDSTHADFLSFVKCRPWKLPPGAHAPFRPRFPPPLILKRFRMAKG